MGGWVVQRPSGRGRWKLRFSFVSQPLMLYKWGPGRGLPGKDKGLHVWFWPKGSPSQGSGEGNVGTAGTSPSCSEPLALPTAGPGSTPVNLVNEGTRERMLEPCG